LFSTKKQRVAVANHPPTLQKEMITKEQYEEYKKLVEDYEQAEYDEKSREADNEFDWMDDDGEECDGCGRPYHDCRCELIANCTCGAYSKTGAHIADCICGAG
jgi:hypothetical protein